MVKLSIIVPIYNVERYLRKCVDSLLAQDISNYEIILVDDGSTDGSGDLCDEIVRANDEMSRKMNDEPEVLNEPHLQCSMGRDKSLNEGKPIIRVIHQENGGLSAARNAGLKVAKGKYVMFVDSDDFIEPNVLGGVMAQVERDNLDVLRFRLQYVNPQYEVYNPYKSDPFKGNDYSEEPTDGVSFLNSRMSTACYAWAFIIRRELLEGCRFTPGIYFEDTDWTPRMLCKARRVASTNMVVYNYLIREGSITNAVNQSKKKKALEDKLRLVGEMQRQANELRKSGRYNKWYFDMISNTVVSIIGMLSLDFYEEKDNYLKQLQSMDIFPIENKSIKTILVNISPRLAVELLHWKNK